MSYAPGTSRRSSTATSCSPSSAALRSTECRWTSNAHKHLLLLLHLFPCGAHVLHIIVALTLISAFLLFLRRHASMGLWDKIKGELIDIVEWTDSSNNTLVYRFERYGNEIKYGAKLVVREGQAAVFVNEGKLADVFKPGMYTLTTQNLPILATLKGWKYGFESPFKAEIYFVSTRQFTDLKWGTMNPVMRRDP